jgi:hypothetical protein
VSEFEAGWTAAIEAAAKLCKGCNQTLNRERFHSDRSSLDGLCHMCRECKAAQRRKWATRNPEKVKEAWQRLEEKRKAPEERKKLNAYRSATRDNPKNRERERRHVKRFVQRYPEKAKAHAAVTRAVAKGLLVRPKFCPRCGAPDRPLRDGRTSIQGHHERQLDVTWVCVECHSSEHRIRR